MDTVMILLEDGFEEVEALGTCDVLVRGGVKVKLVSVNRRKQVNGAHGVTVVADEKLDMSQPYEDINVLVIPGGAAYPKLAKNARVLNLIKQFTKEGRLVAAICGGPVVLQGANILEGKTGTCYPGLEESLSYDHISSELVCQDGQLITSKGPATSLYFGLAILKALGREAEAKAVKQGMLVDLVEETIAK